MNALQSIGKLEKYIIIAIIIAVVFFLLWYFSNIVIYILLSFVLSLIGKPIMDFICNLKVKGKSIPRWLGATAILFIFVGVFVLVINTFIPIVYDKVSLYTNNHIADIKLAIDKPIQKINALIYNYIGDNVELRSSDIISNTSEKISTLLSNTVRNIGSLIDIIGSFFVASFAVFFITFFFLKEDRLFKSGLTVLFPVKYEDKINSALNSSISLLSKYFLALLMESTLKLVIITGGFIIFGLDWETSLIIGCISAVLNVIPYIGPLIGAIVGIVIAIAVYPNDVGELLLFSLCLFAIFQIIDNIIIQPYIYSTSVKAHPLEVFLIILLAGSFAGVWGMLLAIPAYTILRVFSKAFFNNLRVVQKLTENITE